MWVNLHIWVSNWQWNSTFIIMFLATRSPPRRPRWWRGRSRNARPAAAAGQWSRNQVYLFKPFFSPACIKPTLHMYNASKDMKCWNQTIFSQDFSQTFSQTIRNISIGQQIGQQLLVSNYWKCWLPRSSYCSRTRSRRLWLTPSTRVPWRRQTDTRSTSRYVVCVEHHEGII